MTYYSNESIWITKKRNLDPDLSVDPNGRVFIRNRKLYKTGQSVATLHPIEINQPLDSSELPMELQIMPTFDRKSHLTIAVIVICFFATCIYFYVDTRDKKKKSS